MMHSRYDEEELWRRVTGRRRIEGTPLYTDYFLRMVTDIVRKLPEPKDPLEQRIESLENEVSELKKRLEVREEPSKADLIYEKFSQQLEKECFGKIVAIDTESETIVGVGNTILEAYHQARKKLPKSRFSYRRVGYKYIYRLG